MSHMPKNIRRVWLSLASLLFVLPFALPAQTTGEANRTLAPAVPPAVTRPAYTPITEGERAEEYVKNLFSPMAILSAGASAGFGQWRERPKEWKEGWDAYGYRAASAFSEHFVRDTLVFGVSSIAHEDTRYFASGETGFGNRLGYALGSTFTARKSDGSRQLSISKLIGFVGASFISRSWQPHSTDSARSAGLNIATSISVNMGFNVAREFVPKLFHTQR